MTSASGATASLSMAYDDASQGHRVPPRRFKASGKRAQGSADNASWNRPALRPNHIWSYAS